MRVVGYIRVSTDQQVQDGGSLSAQRAKIEAYAKAMDLVLVGVEEDAGVSAKSLARPGLQRALAMLERGEAQGLLITKLDRLTRSVRDLGTLIERYFFRFSLLSVSDSINTRSAAGRMMLNVLVSVAQWERETISERVTEGMAFAKSRGVRFGPSPFGTTPEQEAAVSRILQLRRYGNSLWVIAQRMQHEGYPTKTGAKWTKEAVRSVLARAYQRRETG